MFALNGQALWPVSRGNITSTAAAAATAYCTQYQCMITYMCNSHCALLFNYLQTEVSAVVMQDKTCPAFRVASCLTKKVGVEKHTVLVRAEKLREGLDEMVSHPIVLTGECQITRFIEHGQLCT